MNWIKVPNSQFIRILEKCPDRVSNQGSIGYSVFSNFSLSMQSFTAASKKQSLSRLLEKAVRLLLIMTTKFLNSFSKNIVSFENTFSAHYVH
jgi:hypothetical protein